MAIIQAMPYEELRQRPPWKRSQSLYAQTLRQHRQEVETILSIVTAGRAARIDLREEASPRNYVAALQETCRRRQLPFVVRKQRGQLYAYAVPAGV